MRVSLNWLKRYVDLSGVETGDLEAVFPLLGLEVDSVETRGGQCPEGVVVGEILSSEKHPNADQLSVCKVRVGDGEPLVIVCGAKNYSVGDRVPVALTGVELPGGIVIKKANLRGVESSGMLCSAKELGLGKDGGGLLILSGQPPVGTPLKQLFSKGDTVFNLAVTANRGDCLSHLGVARELAAWFKRSVEKPTVVFDSETTPSVTPNACLKEVSVQTDLCPLYITCCIEGVMVGESPEWLKEALESVGLRPINNIVDVTNFVLMETGQPLHAFDAKNIRGGKLIVRLAHEGESIKTLDGKNHLLQPTMMVIADTEKPLVIAGIMGGEESGVTEKTTHIVLESAYFEPTSIYKTARQLGISTESSLRFSRDVDPQVVEKVLHRAVDLILQVAGGQVIKPICKIGKPPRGDASIEIFPDTIRAHCGLFVHDWVIKDIFLRLGFGVNDEKEKRWIVKVPSYKTDVYRPIDLVEEFLRIFGSHKIPSTEVKYKAIGGQSDDRSFVRLRDARQWFAARQFQECYNYSLRCHAELQRWFGEDAAKSLALKNPLTADYTHIRPSLVPGLLDSVAYNLRRSNDVTRLYEIGRAFRVENGQVFECITMSFVVRKSSGKLTWREQADINFFDAKETLEQMVALLGLENAQEETLWENCREASYNLWQPGYSARWGNLLKDSVEMTCGAVNVEALEEWDIPGIVFAGEVFVLPKVFEKEGETRKHYQPLSAFPPVSKDIALVVENAVSAQSVLRVVSEAAKKAVEGKFEISAITIFDVYHEVEPGKKNLAFSLTFRSHERTLKDDEVNAAFVAIQETIKKHYTIRS